MPPDPVTIEVFRNLFSSVAEEMGVALGRTAYSANIKERLDYSCALFDPDGCMVAQAAHIPVHLGSMPASVQAALDRHTLRPGDVVALNDPYMGGTHLPDITLVAPVFAPAEAGSAPVGFVASRGHHADIGGMTPGSLPLSTDLFQEGLIIPPIKLVRGGRTNRDVVDLLCRNSRTPGERRGDLAAQIAACRVGERRLQGIVARYGWDETHAHMQALLDYAERLTRAAIREVPDGEYAFRDYMDDDGLGGERLPVQVTVRVRGDEMDFDFTGTAPETPGCVNAPFAIALSAVLYVVRCIAGEGVPTNEGVMRPLRVHAPEGCLVNPTPPHAVAGGNVETSQRIVDVLLGALAQALPDRIPAASQGTMNNLLVGGHDTARGVGFAYYETVAGGMGARPDRDGLSGVHTHMTNTLNTPVEALESFFPLRIRRYALRPDTGGGGRFRGGDGIVRDVEFLSPATVTVLSERRRSAPYGLQGGGPGAPGENVLYRGGVEEIRLPAKVTFQAEAGDVLSLRTPGGGGWGAEGTAGGPPAAP
jgi:N-methylhydantoinase B